MTKKEFLAKGRKALSHLPKEELEERLAFYGEMIDDRMEEGLSETDAVMQILKSEETVAHLFLDESFEEEKDEEKKGMGEGAKTALIVAGSPLWFALTVAAVVLWITLAATAFSVVVAVWSVFISFAVTAPVSVLGGLVIALFGRPLAGVAMVGVGLICTGLAVFTYYGANAVGKGGWWLVKKSVAAVKKCFEKKEKKYE